MDDYEYYGLFLTQESVVYPSNLCAKRYCTLIKQYIKGQSIPVECTLKEQ